MKKKSEIKFYEHILLNNSRLSELNIILMKYSDSISYNVETKDKSKIQFSSLDELLGYDNFNKGRITSLTIYCFNKTIMSHSIVVHIPSSVGKETVTVEYEFASVDEESTFSAEIRKLIEKSTEYSKIYQISNWILCIALLGLGFTQIVFEYKANPSYELLSKAFFIYEGGATFLYWLLSHQILDRLFPRIVFLLGEEVGQYERLKKMREFLFGLIISGLIIGLIVNYLSNRLWG